MLVAGNFITYRNSRLHYAKGGSGELAIILFHGFGQDYTAFTEIAAAAASTYTVYAFDLFFHGRSEWNENTQLQKSDWAEILSTFFAKENINRFAVAGYSLGGKFALASIEAFPEKIERVFFLAPDGISINFWYRLATGSAVCRTLFRSMVDRPRRFQDTVRFLRGWNLVQSSVLRFAESQMDTTDKRRRVYASWVFFRHLHFKQKKIAAVLNARSVPTLFIQGRYDKIIPIEKINPLATLLSNKDIKTLEAGHNDLLRHAAALFHL